MELRSVRTVHSALDMSLGLMLVLSIRLGQVVLHVAHVLVDFLTKLLQPFCQTLNLCF